MGNEFVGVYRQVGQFVATTIVGVRRRLRRPSPDGRLIGKGGGNVVTYFCTPDLEVLGWSVGPVDAAELLRSAQEAVDTNRRVQVLNRNDDFHRNVTAHYESLLAPTSRTKFRQWPVSSRYDPTRVSASDLRQAVSMARKVEHDALVGVQRKMTALIRQGIRPSHSQFKNIVAERKRVTEDIPRLVLARYPLVKLDDVQEVVFEQLARQEFDQPSAKDARLLQSVKQSIEKKRPVLLIVDHPYWRKAKDLPNHRELPKLLESFTVVRLSVKELTRLADGLDQPPFEGSRGRARYIVLGRDGSREAVIIWDTKKYQLISEGKVSKGTPQAGLLLTSVLKQALGKTR